MSKINELVYEVLPQFKTNEEVIAETKSDLKAKYKSYDNVFIERWKIDIFDINFSLQ